MLAPGKVKEFLLKDTLMAEPRKAPTVAFLPACAAVFGEMAITLVAGDEKAEVGDKTALVMLGPPVPHTSLAKPAYQVAPIAGWSGRMGWWRS